MSKIVQWELAFRLYLGLFTLQTEIVDVNLSRE